MRIAIDLTPLLPNATGVDRYMLALVSSVLQLGLDHQYFLFINAEDHSRLERRLSGWHAKRSGVRLISVSCRSRAVRLLWQQAILPVVVKRMNIDVVHSPSFLMPMGRAGAGHILTVHDMSSFLLPVHHPWYRRGRVYEWAVCNSIRRADVVIVPSVATRHDVLRAVPEKDPNDVRVIPCGVNARFGPRPLADQAPVLARLGIHWPYVLFVGTLDPRKNLATLLNAYLQVVRGGLVREHLVIAGEPGWKGGISMKNLPEELQDRVHLLGYVADSDLPLLYAGATVFAYPSLMEGFGFPPLEAMACGTPVIASDGSALRENLQGAAYLVPPNDTAVIARALECMLGDPGLRAQYIKAGAERASRFQWASLAQTTAACYEEVARRRNPSAVRAA